MKSIRTHLVAWLVSALALGTVVVLAATYTLTRNQVGRLFDDELKQVAHAVLLREDWMQAGRVRIARPGFQLSIRAYDNTGRLFFATALPSLPDDTPQTFQEGFARVQTVEGPWRVYTHVTAEGIVQVGQPLETRDFLARKLSVSVLMPFLLLIPVLAGLIAWVLKRGLAPLDATSRRVSDRDASRLDPLPTGDVPAELVPLIEQINALMKRLEASLDGQRRFLADAAHELRSPVAALALQVQLAQRAHSDGARTGALRDLAHGIERSRRLVHQLLDYARMEPGVPTEPLAPVDLALLAREAVGSSAPRAEELGVDLGADAPTAAPVKGSASELRSLISNLVDNALRYAPRDSSVTVAVREDGDGVELSIVDAGPGIPQAERERVFERFYRVTGDPTPGSGLGLSIVKAIVERHGAHMTLGEAAPGSEKPGLAVRIRFRAYVPPLEPRPAPASAAAEPAATPSYMRRASSAPGRAP